MKKISIQLFWTWSILLLFVWIPSGKAEILDCASLKDTIATPAKSVTIEGENAVQHASSLTFRCSAGVGAQSGAHYVKIRYLDQGYGLLQVYYLARSGSFEKTLRHTRSSRVNTGKWVDSYHLLNDASFPSAAPEHLIVRIDNPDGGQLIIQSVELESTPFDDLTFQKVISESWKNPPPLNETSAAQPPKSLRNTIMVGYQGWFSTPNDLNDTGWGHWFKSQTRAEPELVSVDMWPDPRFYPASELVPAESMLTRSGKPALVYSSTSEEIMRAQMRLLRENGIDGVFVERFGPPPPKQEGQQWVLSAVRRAANSEGRVWAIEYDISMLGGTDMQHLDRFKTDWIWLVDELKILNDKFYLRENGKPVVLFWGLSFPVRKFTPRKADMIIDFLKNDPKYGGNYVIGGIPNMWRNMPQWYSHFRKYDRLMPWQGWNRTKEYTKDRETFANWGVAYYAHLWPGYSAHNRSGGPLNEWNRKQGEYYWKQLNQAISEGNDALYIGMLDELDEGTSILPMSDDLPLEVELLNNDGIPSDSWLKLSGFAKQIFEGKRRVNQPFPLTPQ